MISASLVKELREATGAGMLDCKKALEASNGNIDEAVTWLREKGISKAAKKASRIAAEGLAVAKINGNKAVVLEVNSETDFVAKNEEFVNLVNTIAETVLENDVNTIEDAMKLTVNGKTVVEEKPVEEKSQMIDLTILTVNELKELAKKKEVKGYSKMKKEELIEILK